MTDQSSCGCVWERHKDFGDVVVTKCVQHDAVSRSRRAKAAAFEADRAEAEFRRRRANKEK
jgi:hypothetical protein